MITGLWIDGTSEQKGYDAATDSIKFSASNTLPNGWYMDIQPSDDYEIDSSKYGYAKICYKVNTNVTDRWAYFSLFTGNWPGIILFTQIEDTHKEFNEYVLDLNERFSADANGYDWSSSGIINIKNGAKFGFSFTSAGSDRSSNEAFYIKYVAFFTTKKAAEDFSFDEWLSKNSESSAPESSAPEASKPSADTGHATIISAVALMFGAAAAVVTLSLKKR